MPQGPLQLAAALAACRAHRATLAVAKFDRLARNVVFVSARTKAARAAAEVRGVRLGNPRLRAGTAEQARAAAAVKGATARVRATDVLPYVEQARRAGAVMLAQIAAALTTRGVPTPSGSGTWHRATVRGMLTSQAA